MCFALTLTNLERLHSLLSRLVIIILRKFGAIPGVKEGKFYSLKYKSC